MNDQNEYRMKLSMKLAVLTAVLKVAIAKLERSQEEPGTDVERVEALLVKLNNTLSTCERARATIEAQLTTEDVGEPGIYPDAELASERARQYVELTNMAEYQKFKDLPPITLDEVGETDLDDLIEQLGNE